MKKIHFISLSIIVLLFNGCSNSNTSSTTTESETTTTAIVETVEDTRNESTAVESTIESSENITESDIPIELPNTEGLTHALADVFISIGLNTVPPLEFKNYENLSGTISIDVYALPMIIALSFRLNTLGAYKVRECVMNKLTTNLRSQILFLNVRTHECMNKSKYGLN